MQKINTRIEEDEEFVDNGEHVDEEDDIEIEDYESDDPIRWFIYRLLVLYLLFDFLKSSFWYLLHIFVN